MSATRAIQKKAAYHARGLLRILGSVGLAFTGYSVAVSVYMERRWKAGNSRIFDQPNWNGYSMEEKDLIIAGRERFVQGLKNLYELHEEAIKDPVVLNLFSEDSVLEDPKIRFVGRHEIIRAFSLMPRKIEYLHFIVFEPVHFKEKIVINTSREFELKNKPDYFNYEPKKIIRSSFVIYLSKDDNEEEKIKYIADEWNSVSILQPETHNAFMFAGSVAKFSRRVGAVLYYLSAKEHKSILNPYFLAEFSGKISKFLEETYGPNSIVEKTESDLKEEDVSSFNAGKVQTQD